ncbi:MAG: permease [Geminicoccaceae bacterium]|nr:permease [Geminicoccaceae bacterium]
MRTIQLRLADEYPTEQAHWTSISFRTFSQELFGDLRATLFLISASIGLVLLLACANVANLFLVRAGSRARELAVRSVLGAGRWRIVRQLATETFVVAALAGVLGALLGHALVGFVRQYAAERLPFGGEIALDGRALLFALGAATLSALLVGILPALYASRTGANLMDRLRSGATAAIGSGGERRARSVLVSLQFGLAFTLLVGAGLLIQSVRKVLSTPLGYDPTNVIAFNLAPTGKKYEAPADAALLYRRIADAVDAVPGVEMAAIAGGALIPTKVEATGQPTDGQELRALYHPVSAEYLRTLRMPLVAGQWFTEDDMRAPNGFVINETLAKRLFAGADPIGRPITTYRASQARADFGQPITLPVIGVVGDVRQFGRESDVNPELFLPYTLEVWPWMNFVARAQNPSGVLRSVEAAVRSVDPAINLRSEPSVLDVGLPAVRRFVTSLLSGFAVAALLLAATGLYGIIDPDRAGCVAPRHRGTRTARRRAVRDRWRDPRSRRLVRGHAAPALDAVRDERDRSGDVRRRPDRARRRGAGGELPPGAPRGAYGSAGCNQGGLITAVIDKKVSEWAQVRGRPPRGWTTLGREEGSK